ncbi:cache domain-containing protein [Paeniglutamicibacter cryotolerans]|uniref:Cache domain-containing protein n=1 Tax=Paeniglutamicibacter cryotolerans TaxID=670079 RepID=A0A839QRA6_9MICC|nr:cache domain-containing protein [Paeniglutamicibacter cryotolerans]MBB2995792.1 hypothetical protein [Paeniglutamicibacter cryotolerans]
MNSAPGTGTPPGGAIQDFFASILADLREWSGGVTALFEASASAPTRRVVDDAVQPLALGLLGESTLPLVGGGFVAARDALADATWHMAWWQGATRERLLLMAMESAGETYSRREWFTVPMESGRGHITGPYVDFLCTDEYTVTFTVPVESGGRRVGIAGADILVESLEDLLMERILAIGSKAALVNRSGRVILSPDPQLAAGLLLAPGWQDAVDGWLAVDGAGSENMNVIRCGDLPLAVVSP